MVKEKGGQESKDNVEEDNAGSKVHMSDDHLASPFPEPNEEENMMEVEMDVEMPEDNETSQVFPPDTLKVSMVKEKGGKGSKDNIG
eukprot:4238036-Ditylum_brightwellii.AAC.1